MIPGCIILAIAFLACLVWTFRRSGIRIIAVLLIAGLAIGVLLPLVVLRGYAPLPFALGIVVLIVGVGTPLVGGWNRKSLAAALGATGAMALAACLPLALAAHMQLTGLDTHFGPWPHPEVRLWFDPAFGRVDFAGLGLTAIILVSIGAILDVALVIASTVEQGTASNPDLPFRERLRMGLRVGSSVLGPMLVTMMLIFLGSELVPMVGRASVPGDPWDALRWFNYGHSTSEVLGVAAAGVGLLACIPLSALFAALLLSGPKSAPVKHDSGPTRTSAHVPLRITGVVAILLTCLAIDRGFIASHDRLSATASGFPGARSQECMAKILSTQPPIILPIDPDAVYNPVRGAAPHRLVPTAARVLTGENRGKTVVFVNLLQDRPYVNVKLRAGMLAQLSVTTKDKHTVGVELYPLPMRWRALLWIMAVLLAVMVGAFKRDGWRSALLCICILAVVTLLAVPLIVGGLSPALAVLLTLVLLASVVVLLWGKGWLPGVYTVAGTAIGLLAGGLIAFVSARLLGLDGSASALVRLLRPRPALRDLSFEQLIAAGTALVVMGAALDIAASVISGMVEFRRVNPLASALEVREVGLRVNRDVTGMMLLTLLCAWLAIHLPVFLIMWRSADAFTDQCMECYAMEVVRFVSASVTLMLTGFATTRIFARHASDNRQKRNRSEVGTRRIAPICFGLIAVFAALWLAHTVSTRTPPASKDAPLAKENPSAEQLLALSLERQRNTDWDGSIILLWRAREIEPDNAFVHRDLAYAYLSRRWPQLARDSISKALPSLVGDARTRYISGVLSWWEGDLATARQELMQAVKIDPAFHEAAEALRQMPSF